VLPRPHTGRMDARRRRRWLAVQLAIVFAIVGVATALADSPLPLIGAAPWVIGVVWFAFRNGPGDPDTFPSAADLARRRWVS
jgi:hypothetical protein